MAINLLISCIIVTLNSCATTGKYSAKMQTWMGHDVNELINSWGPPSDVYTMPNGNKMYTWLWTGGTLVTTNYYYYLNMAVSNGVTYWCKTTFTVNGNTVVAYRWEGNSCLSE